MTTRIHCMTALCFVAAALISATASAYDPLPWDSSYTPPPRVEYRPQRSSPTPHGGTMRLFGAFGASLDFNATLGSDISGVGAGQGYSLAIPATLPAWIVYGLAVDPSAVLAPVASETWSSGFRGDGLGTAPVMDEVMFQFIYSVSSHKDLLYGGSLTLSRYALGIRTMGPGPVDRRVRGSISVGWCWHDLSFDARPNRDTSGPYAGVGLEFRTSAFGPGKKVGFTIDARWDYGVGSDGTGGVVSAEFFNAGVGVQFYW